MTSAAIRQGFLDFFKGKGHTIVASSPLMPDSPNLLFTNAGMNQFVPIFLAQQPCPYQPPRAVDTQKCIRAGGKHNDLEDVGLDTYHHTFFEMLGNWSFGEAASKDGIGRGYFKKEAIEWAWELLTRVWKFPKNRLYATVYKPGEGDPAELDREAYDCWKKIFDAEGLSAEERIVFGNKKDNFWMMGDTGPCGPCSEIHVDLTPKGDSHGRLVNQGSPQCIEIWNLVFIQFNANADGTFSPLPARHVDTGAGFERIASIVQCTRNFTDFSGHVSNYETDVFRPIFDELEKISGKKYGSTLPKSDRHSPQEQVDIAFRVIADHIRTLSFAIADGILPGNTDRNYVLRRILRRAVRYGRSLGLHEPFFHLLADVLVRQMGGVFPELRKHQPRIEQTIHAEEQSFSRTLDRGIALFNETKDAVLKGSAAQGTGGRQTAPVFPAGEAFKLYDTYGFPLDLTDLMARECGLAVDHKGFERLMEEQRRRAREAQRKEVIFIESEVRQPPTDFVGFKTLSIRSEILGTGSHGPESHFIIARHSPFYAEMGGQVGDQGFIKSADGEFKVLDTLRTASGVHLHFVDRFPGNVLRQGKASELHVDEPRRRAIERHHSVTHLFHWALHEVVSRDAAQKGSYVGPDRLRFDFNHEALTPAQIADIEKLVNERILENAPVSWIEVPYAEVKSRKDVMQFFGDKYGEAVRVVQIGGKPAALDGYSMELCGGTHVRATGEIGIFKVVREGAIAAGVRRIEAVSGPAACDFLDSHLAERIEASGKWSRQWVRLGAELGHAGGPPAEKSWKSRARLQELRARGDTFCAADWTLIDSEFRAATAEAEKWHSQVLELEKELEKRRKAGEQKEAAARTEELLGRARPRRDIPCIIENLGDASGDFLRAVAENLKSRGFPGVAVLAGQSSGKAGLVAYVAPGHTKRVQAGQIIKTIAPIIGGGGGGKPDFAQAGGKNPEKIAEALTQAESLLS